MRSASGGLLEINSTILYTTRALGFRLLLFLSFHRLINLFGTQGCQIFIIYIYII